MNKRYFLDIESARVAILGLGYVGLPLAVEFGKRLPTIGYDIDKDRVEELIKGNDVTLECDKEELIKSEYLSFTSSLENIMQSNVYIVTLPTPIDEYKQPDLRPLIEVSKTLGKVIDRGDVIIYESTVYPGATEEDCIPVIERSSGLKLNQDFYVGYSPERVNPGDKSRRLTNIHKVTSGSNPEAADFVDELYNTIISAGTHKASSIKVAEASKIIENVQRDVNIALVNELHQIFSRLNIGTKEVIEAASTKWNFMSLKPGLVGGHCISVDPYYLLHKSQTSGYVPDLIRKAREINDFMPSYLAQDFLNNLIKKRINPIDCHVGLLGFTFKENCPDVRNTKVYNLYNELIMLGFSVSIYDPWADVDDVRTEYDVSINSVLDNHYDVGFLAVGHETIIDYLKMYNDKYIYDFKGLLNS